MNSSTFLLTRVIRQLCALTGTAALTVGTGLAADLPQGAAVVAGDVAVSTSGDRMDVVQKSDRAIVNWDSFSIGAEAAVRIAQPASSSLLLNRVTGGDPSRIFGSLSANGIVLLVNRAGVYFSPTSKVDVGSLIASTSDVANADVIAGHLRFSGMPGAGRVENAGHISVAAGGLAALVAPSVANSGVIRAKLGKVALASGSRFELDLFGDGLVKFALGDAVLDELQSGDGTTLRTVLDQSGTISADGGEVLLLASTATHIVDGLVNVGGLVEARSVQDQGGRIVLSGGDTTVHVAGALDASSETGRGGAIEITGREVTLADGAHLDASGAQGGGRIRVGGGYQGGENLAASERTLVANGARIDASSSAGRGGDVVLWSDGRTDFSGTIVAGGASDAGGSVEVSGKKLLQFLGDVTAGPGGSLLLDPENVEIRAFGSTDLDNATGISAAALNRALRNGTTKVTIDASNDITVAEAINGIPTTPGAGGVGLDLIAGHSVIILKPIGTASANATTGGITVSAATGTISIAADAFLYVADAADTSRPGAAPITLTAALDIDVKGQLYSLGQVKLTSGQDIKIAQALTGVSLANGAASGIGSLAATAGRDLALAGAYTSATGNVNGIGLSAKRNLVNDGAALYAGTGSIAVADAAMVTLNKSVVSAVGSVGIGKSDARVGGVALATGAKLEASPDAGDVSVFSTGSIAANELLAGKTGKVELNSSAGSVTVSAPVAGFAATANAAGAGVGRLVVSARDNVVLRGVLANGSASATGATIDLTAGGSLTNTLQSISSVAGNISVKAGGALTLGGAPAESGTTTPVAIQARGSGATVTIAPISTAGGALSLKGSVLAADGNVLIGSTTQRFSSITSDAGLTVGAQRGVGSTRLYSDGNLDLATVVAGTEGDVELDSRNGSVAVMDAINGVGVADKPQGVKSLTIRSGKETSIHGAYANGTSTPYAIDVTTGVPGSSATPSFTNTGSRLTSASGVKIDSGGGVQLDATTDVSTVAIEARGLGSPVLLSRSGTGAAAVSINGSVLTRGGLISVGTATAPFSSVTMLGDSVLQTVVGIGAPGAYTGIEAGTSAGDISLYSTENQTLGGLVGGTLANVLVNASGLAVVNLQSPLAGLIVGGQPQGIGTLNVSSGSRIFYNGAKTVQTGTTSSVALTAPHLIQIDGPTIASGNVLFGATGGTPGALIFLNHNVATDGHDATFNGEVRLFTIADGVAATGPVGNASRGIDLIDLLTPGGRYGYERMTSEGLFVEAGGTLEQFDTPFSTDPSNFSYFRPAVCGVNDGVYCWPGLFDDATYAAAHTLTGTDGRTIVTDAATFLSGCVLDLTNCSGTTVDLKTLFLFAKKAYEVAGRDGAPSGFKYVVYPQITAAPTDPVVIQSLTQEARNRVQFLSRLLGNLNVSVDVSASAGGSIQFNSSILQGKSAALNPATNTLLSPAYVNEALNLKVNGGAVTFADQLGRPDAINYQSGDWQGRSVRAPDSPAPPHDHINDVSPSSTAPLEGTFQLTIARSSAGTTAVSLGQGDLFGLYLDRLGCAPSCSYTGLLKTDSAVLDPSAAAGPLGSAMTSPGINGSSKISMLYSGLFLGVYGISATAGPPPPKSTVGDIRGPGGYTGRRLTDTEGGTTTVTSRNPLGDPGQGKPGGTSLVDIPEAISAAPSVAEEATRDESDKNSSSGEADSQDEEADENRCNRGSASYADTGQSEGKTGAPANVFDLCRRDLGGQQTASL